MSQFNKALCLAALLSGCTAWAGDFAVEQISNGDYRIKFRDKVLIDSVTASKFRNAQKPPQYSVVDLPDGGKSYNVWSDEKDRNFRTEIAIDGAGKSVEITYMSECRAFAPTVYDARLVTLTIPYAQFAKGSYKGYAGRATTLNIKNGSLADLKPKTPFDGTDFRYLALSDGQGRDVVLDFNPIGPGDFISIYHFGAIKGLWHCRRDTDKLRFFGGSIVKEQGGFTGAKVRITAGNFNDYDRDHALKNFFYDQAFAPNRLYSFGAIQKSKDYTAADLQKSSPGKQAGWQQIAAPAIRNSRFPGAYYSNVSGENGVFTVKNLHNGVYLATVGIGNIQNLPHRFTLACNNIEMVRDFTVPDHDMAVISLPLWIENGTAEFKFDGKFIVSTIALQRLLAPAEDFSFRRGPWRADGFEPGNIFRNCDYKTPPRFAVSVEQSYLPEPGKEMANPRRTPERPVATARPDNPNMTFRYNAMIGSCMSNSSTLAEMEDPESRKAFIEQQKERNVNLLMLSGLHSRHTYFNHIERGKKAIISMAQEAHKHNMKLVDHHDVTLLWNLDGGFRILAENLDETARQLSTQLPTYQLCIMNPDFKRRYTDYILDLVRGGVDGFMLDEASFFPGTCSCSHCRKKFFEDTNWHLPVNELDPFFGNNNTIPLKQAWQNWRKIKVGNWWVDLRREIDKINPNVTLLVYTTHYGYVDRWAPLRLGTDLFEDARGADFFGTEIMTRNVLRSARTLPGYRRAKNLLKIAYGAPVWGLVQTQYNWDGIYFGWALLNMHAQSVWMVHSAIKETGRKDFLTFNAENMRRELAEPVTEIALLFSSASRDYSPTGGMAGELFGTAQTLDMMHIPYSIIGQMSLKPEVLNKYKVLIAAGAGCLADEEIAAIREFASRGGTVLLTGNSGLYNENGLVRKVWPFADIFRQSPAKDLSWVRRFALPDTDRVNMSKAVRFFPLPKRREHYLEEKFGQGRIAYLNIELASQLYAQEGTPGRMWNFVVDPAVDKSYRQVLKKLISHAEVWKTDAPEMVLTSIYRQQDDLVVHFLNATGCENTPGQPMKMEMPDPAFPALKKDITFTVPGAWQSAYAVSPDFAGRRQLKVTNGNQIVLPKELLNVYTIVFIKK